MNARDRARYRFGSAQFATERDISRAGFFKQTPSGFYCGTFNGKPLFYNDLGGIGLWAGARGGKGSTILMQNACPGILTENSAWLDPRCEVGVIAQFQVPDNKHLFYFNAYALNEMPQHRINPFELLNIWNPRLLADARVFAQNFISKSGAENAAYFEGRAQDILTAIFLALAERDSVVTAPALYDVVTQLLIGGEAWTKGFGFDLFDSQFPLCRRVEAEIKEGNEDSSGGYRGILGELTRAVSCLSDNHLMAALSPPYDLCLNDLVTSKINAMLLLQPPVEYLSSWAPILKSTLVCMMLQKTRAPSAPRVTLVVDEAGQLEGFPELIKAFSYGAGAGLRPVGVWQSFSQMKHLGPDAETIIPASCQLRLTFAPRDLASATTISRMLGQETLHWDDTGQQARAAHAKKQAVWAMMNGEDPTAASLRTSHQASMQAHQSAKARDLRTASEVLNMRADRGYLFTDAIAHPVEIERTAYYRQKFMDGRFFSSPIHPPHDHVRVKRWWGHRKLWVHEAPTPDTLKSFPQYAAGTWRYLSPERPAPCPNPSPPATPTSPTTASAPMPAPPETSDPSNGTP